MRHTLFRNVMAVAVAAFCLVGLGLYSSGYLFELRGHMARLSLYSPLSPLSPSPPSPNTPSLPSVPPCRLDAQGIPLVSPPNEPPCVRRYFFFNLDNRELDQKAVMNATYIPLTVGANAFYVRSASKWIAANEEYKYIYYHANISCKTSALECEGPLNLTTNKPTVLHPSWVAVKVILDLLDNKMQAGDVAVSLDTDVVLKSERNQSLHAAFHHLIPGFMNGSTPIALTRDGSYWKAISAPVYSIDINSGIIMFVKTPACHKFFRALWASALVESPFEKANYTKFHFHRSWPWMQERLSWFASDPKWQADVVLIPQKDWTKALPGCWEIICHLLQDKMDTITHELSDMYVQSLDCADPDFSPLCSKQEHAVVLRDWLNRPINVPFRSYRFNPTVDNLWQLTRIILKRELSFGNLQTLSAR